jgi:WhiB family redox-sensing transcriptional regulator
VAEQLDWRWFAECAKTKNVRDAYDRAVELVGTQDELVYPEKIHEQTCGTCPVQSECLGEALADEHLVGIWGGTTDYQRRQLRRRRVRERCPRCDNDLVIPENGHELCLACGASWQAE